MIWNKSEVTTAWMLMTFSSSYVKTADEAPNTTQRSASHRDIGQSILHQQLYNNLFSSDPRHNNYVWNKEIVLTIRK